MFGLGLVGIVIFANLIKYPFFRFGPRYAATTGMSLIEGYRRISPWALALVTLLMFAVHIIVIAATAITTAGIGLAAASLAFDARLTAVCFIILGLVMMFTSGYHLLDRVTKVFVAILTITTLVATALVIPNISWSIGAFALPPLSVATFAFIVAPVIALFNHIAMTSRDVPPEAQPSTAMRAWSWTGIVLLSAITFAYLYTICALSRAGG